MKKISNIKFQISNIKYRILTCLPAPRAGFTFIELLAVMVIILIVGVIIGSILFSALRGSSKTNTMTEVRQNGNNAITQMVKMLRGAKKLDYPNSCIPPLPPDPAPSYSYIAFTSLDGGQTTFSCDSSTISSNSASLLNTDSVSLFSCAFYCSQSDILDFPTVSINFSLTQSYTGSFVEKIASKSAIPFSTSVTLRNLRK